MELLAHPSLAAPRLLAGPEQGGDAGRLSLPPPPPPPQRGSVVPAPEPLQRLFPGGAGAGKGATGVLQQLLSQALERLDASCALGAGQPGSGGQKLLLHVSPDIDFGTVAVSRLAGEQLLQAAHSVAAGLPSSGSTVRGYAATAGAASQAGSLLDLLHLASQEQRLRCQGGSLQSSGAATAADSGAGNTNSDVAPGSPAGSVLHFRQLAVANTSHSDTLWLLGGIAAPAFPHTLAAVDDARLFWLEGGCGREGCGWLGTPAAQRASLTQFLARQRGLPARMAHPRKLTHSCPVRNHHPYTEFSLIHTPELPLLPLPFCRPPSGPPGPAAAAHRRGGPQLGRLRGAATGTRCPAAAAPPGVCGAAPQPAGAAAWRAAGRALRRRPCTRAGQQRWQCSGGCSRGTGKRSGDRSSDGRRARGLCSRGFLPAVCGGASGDCRPGGQPRRAGFASGL